MPNPNDNPGESYEGFDVANAAKDIGNDLFTKSTPDTLIERNEYNEQDNSAELVAKPEVTPEVVKDPLTPEPRVEPGINSVVTAPLPKSWKKDMQPIWEKADPALHAYVAEREQNVMRGIQQYAAGHNNWDALIKPFAPILQQNPDVNPIQLMQGLMNVHLQLLNPNGSTEQKHAIINNLLQEYGISFNQENQTPQDTALIQRLRAAEEKLAENDRRYENWQRQTYEQGVQTHLQTVEQFQSDPKNKYFEEVGNDILRLLATNPAMSLPEAYENACWTNPVVRAKMLAEQQASSVQPDSRPRKPNGQFVNLDETPIRTRVAKPKSMDETIDTVVASHYSKH